MENVGQKRKYYNIRTMKNELIDLIDHINIITSDILIKFHTGIELTDLQEDIIRELYRCSEENHLMSLEDFPHINNNYINQIIMGRTQGSKNKSKINLINKNMGKLNLNSEILTLDGKPVKGTPEEGNLTIKKAIKFATLNAEMDKKSGEEKYNAYKLAMKIETENPDFTVEELASIKKSVGTVFSAPEIIGFIYDAIDTK